jgi:hypothetical protein
MLLREPMVPCPPKGYRSWGEVPESKKGPYYEWYGRRAIRDRHEQARLLAKGIALLIWLVVGVAIGAGIAVAVMW